jgi:hypothetical protein
MKKKRLFKASEKTSWTQWCIVPDTRETEKGGLQEHKASLGTQQGKK